jgi:hypothetical protein
MYNTRLKQWGVCKNYKAGEKELLAVRITQAHLENRSLDTITFKNRPVKFDRVLRYCKSRNRKTSGPSSKPVSFKTPSRRRPAVAQAAEQDSDTWVDPKSIADILQKQERDSMVRVRKAERRRPKRRQGTVTPESDFTSATTLTPGESESESSEEYEDVVGNADGTTLDTSFNPLDVDQGHNIHPNQHHTRSDSEHQLQEAEPLHQCPGIGSLNYQYSHPSPPLFPPKGATVDVELVLNQTRVYYLGHIEKLRAQTVEIYNVTDPTNMFWTNIKSAIYFLKRQSPALAWPLLNEACTMMAAGDMLSSAPVLFLNSVFAVLSPTNTRICPMVRGVVLRYISQMAEIKLTPMHPLSVVCRELSRSTDSHNEFGGSETTAWETALTLTLDLLTQHLGRDHGGTFAVHRSLVSLLRRDRRLEAARRSCERLVTVTERALISQTLPERSGLLGQTLGVTPGGSVVGGGGAASTTDLVRQKPTSISVTELCITMTELVHIDIDLRDYGRAQVLCRQVIENYGVVQGVNFPDSRAAYALEDMAELCQSLQDYEGAASWLRQALDASCMLRGAGDAATLHVKDKLEELQELQQLRRGLEPGNEQLTL